MPSTFFGLTIASSGLNAYQIALNTTANNISNLRTVGYSRQQANRVASDALRVCAKYGSTGTGVTTTEIKQIRNEYYDQKYWYNQSSVGLYETRLDYLLQIENYFLDDGEDANGMKGFNTIFDSMFRALDTLKHSAADTEVRQQFIGKSQNLMTYFNSVSLGLRQIQSSTNAEIRATVQNINAIAEKIAILNKQINIIEVQGGYANELRDQRALLVDELSKIVPTEVSEVPVKNTNYPDMQIGSNYYTVKIGGQLLVRTDEYTTLECRVREEKINQSDIDGLYDVIWSDTGNSFRAGGDSMSGTLKALFDIRDGNNAENFTGAIEATSGNTIRVTNPSITAIEAMNMPESGLLTINGKNYKYIDFEFEYEKDAEGNYSITSYTFRLEDTLTTEDQSKMRGRTVSIGSAVDSMGIPYYMAQMNMFLRSFSKKFNDVLKQGVDLSGNKTDYYSFFTNTKTSDKTEFNFSDQDFPAGTDKITLKSSSDSYYRMTAYGVHVSDACVRDPDKLSTTVDIAGKNGVDAYELLDELSKLEKDTIVYRGGNAAGFLKCIITDISVDTQESKIFYQNYSNISETIDNQRMSVSGVDEDEEALDLIRFQNAYNLSSKMISIMTELYDRLILQTGV